MELDGPFLDDRDYSTCSTLMPKQNKTHSTRVIDVVVAHPSDGIVVASSGVDVVAGAGQSGGATAFQ
jgi:hypothetical protein